MTYAESVPSDGTSDYYSSPSEQHYSPFAHSPISGTASL